MRLLSIIVPCRNEAAHITRFLENVQSLSTPDDCEIELLIAEGRSDDGTAELLESAQGSLPFLRVLDNPRRQVAAGLNHAIRQSKGEIIVRLDVHSEYASDYLIECVNALESGAADNVGGPWRARGTNEKSRAIALAFQCPFVAGGGRAHDVCHEGYVDTVYLGCWHKTTLEQLGLFDERLVRAQDSELNFRIHRNGGRVWQTPRIRSWYAPRGSLRELFLQYQQYGYWKVVTLRIHRRPATLRQLCPAMFILALGTMAALAPWSFTAALGFCALAGCYVAVSCVTAVQLCSGPENRSLLKWMLPVFAAYHFGYGWGYLKGLVREIVLHRRPSTEMLRLTRSTTRDP